MTRLRAFFYYFLCSATVLSAGPPEPFAFIRNNDIYLVETDDSGARQVTADGSRKWALRWTSDGRRLSYLEKDPDGGMARLSVIDRDGKRLANAVIRPATEPTEGLRAIEDTAWLSDRTVRVSGSVNPENCEIFDFDLVSHKESNDQYGRCGSFTYSPDGKHAASLGPISMGVSEEDRVDTVQIDDEAFVYRSNGAAPFFVLAGPVWSEDSQSVAIVERRRESGEIACTIISLPAKVERFPLSSSVVSPNAIRWIGARVVVGDKDSSIGIDRISKKIGPLTSDIFTMMKLAIESERQKQTVRSRAQALTSQYHAQEGVFRSSR